MLRLHSILKTPRLYCIISIKRMKTTLKNVDRMLESNFDKNIKSTEELSTLKTWLKLMNDYNEIVNFRKAIRSGSILAHQFSMLPFRCHGCGSFFHTNSQDKRGHITNDQIYWLMKNAISFYDLYCTNCTSNSNDKLYQLVTVDEYLNELSFLNKKPTLYLHVIDICDIEGSICMNYYKNIHNDSNVLFVVNKIDRLTTKIGNIEEINDIICNHINSIIQWDSKKIIDTVYVSCKYYFGLLSLFKWLSQIDLNRDVCIVGKSNVGKSSLFNMIQNIIHLSIDRTNKLIPIQSCVSEFPGTTAGLIRHPINTRYFVGGYHYLKSLFLKFKEENNYNLNEAINNNLMYTVDSYLKHDLFGTHPMDIHPKTKKYIEQCLESNAKDYNKFHQANSLYSSMKRLDYYNKNYRFDHNKYSWLYDTPSYSNNVKNESIYAKVISYDLSEKNNDDDNSDVIKPIHKKITSNIVVSIENFCYIELVDKQLIHHKINNEMLDTTDSNRKELNYVELFFHLPSSLHNKIYIHEKETLSNYNLKKHIFEFLGHGFNVSSCEVGLNSLGWITLFGPSYSLIKIHIYTLDSISPKLRTIPLVKYRPSNNPEKSLLTMYTAEGNIHFFEKKLQHPINMHLAYTYGQREYQINVIKDYFLHQKLSSNLMESTSSNSDYAELKSLK